MGISLVFSLLRPDMDKTAFYCGESALDGYIQKQASQDMRRGFATVIVAQADLSAPIAQATTSNSMMHGIVGFYTLSAASIVLSSLPENMARKMPRYPTVPAVRLGRLAVHEDFQGQHIGSLLLLDALRRSCHNELAWAVFIVDAKNEQVAHFYKNFLFQSFTDNTRTLWMHRKQAERIILEL